MKMKRSPTGKVVVVPLCVKLVLTTDGSNTTWTFLDIPMPEIEDWGPYIMGITAHARGENFTSQFKWTVVFWTCTDGRNFPATPTNLFTPLTATGDSPQTEYTGGFGLNTKFGLACINASGTAIERGVVTVALAIKLLT